MPDTITPDQAELDNSHITFVGYDPASPEQNQTEQETPNEQVTEETTQAEEDAQASEQEQTEEIEPKKKNKLEQRFSEITRKKNDAIRLAESERLAREKAEAELELYKNQHVALEPQYENFADPLEYAKALAQYEKKQGIIETEKRIKQQQEQDRLKENNARWLQKEALVRAEYPDYDLIVTSAQDTYVPMEIQDAILESDLGPELLYHLSNDDALVAKLARLPTTSALKELGKIEARIEQDKAKPKLVKGSNAPAPITPIKQSSKISDNFTPKGNIFVDNLDDYRRLRESGKIR